MENQLLAQSSLTLYIADDNLKYVKARTAAYVEEQKFYIQTPRLPTH
jgi:hypothetical protein